MYGLDGNFSALAWAELYGLDAVTASDKEELISEGYFTSCGKRTKKKRRVQSMLDAS